MLFSAGLADVAPLTLPHGGIYTLLIEGFVSTTAATPYSFRLLPPTPLPLGDR